MFIAQAGLEALGLPIVACAVIMGFREARTAYAFFHDRKNGKPPAVVVCPLSDSKELQDHLREQRDEASMVQEMRDKQLADPPRKHTEEIAELGRAIAAQSEIAKKSYDKLCEIKTVLVANGGGQRKG